MQASFLRGIVPGRRRRRRRRRRWWRGDLGTLARAFTAAAHLGKDANGLRWKKKSGARHEEWSSLILFLFGRIHTHTHTHLTFYD